MKLVSTVHPRSRSTSTVKLTQPSPVLRERTLTSRIGSSLTTVYLVQRLMLVKRKVSLQSPIRLIRSVRKGSGASQVLRLDGQ